MSYANSVLKFSNLFFYITDPDYFGSVPLTYNSESIKSPNEKESVTEKQFEMINEYLRTITNMSYCFKSIYLINLGFCNYLIELNDFNPQITKVIDRVNILSTIKHKLLLISLKAEIFELYSKGNYNNDDKKLIKYAYLSVIGSIVRFQNIEHTFVIINPQSFIENSIKDIKKLNSLNKESVRHLYNIGYENNLLSRINLAISLTKNLEDDLKQRFEDINLSLGKTINEVSKLRNITKDDIKKLEKEKDKLFDIILTKNIFAVVGVVSQLLNFFGPVGRLTVMMVSSGGIIAVSLIDGNIKPIAEPSKFPLLIEKFQDHFKKQRERVLKKIREKALALQKVDEISNTSPFKKEYLKQQSLNIMIENLSETPQKYSLKLEYLEYEKMAIKPEDGEKKLEYNKMIDEAKKKNEQLTKQHKMIATNTAKVGAATLEVAKIAVDTYKSNQITNDEIKKIDELIKDKETEIKALNYLEQKINEYQIKLLKDSYSSFFELTSALQSKSLPTLFFHRWNIKNTIIDMKNDITELLSDFVKQKADIESIFGRMNSAFDTLIEIYDTIDRYKEQIEFAKYILDITNNEINYDIPLQYQQIINELEKKIKSNIISERYQQAIETLKLWSYPFFCELTKDLPLYNIVDGKNEKTSDTSKMATTYAQSLTKINDKMKNYEVTLIPYIDNYIQNKNFENDFAFYKWSSLKCPFEFNQLFNGTFAVFHANVEYSQFDSVKFNSIGIVFEITPEKTVVLNNLLRNFYVELIHPGISYFKHRNHTYVNNLIPPNLSSLHEKLLLRYSYGSSENLNELARKLSLSRPLLSPYTFWEIRLKPKDSNKKEEYSSALKNLTIDEETIISLNGKGSYIVEPPINQKMNCLLQKIE